MTNQNTKETDDVGVVNVEEGISSEEADTRHDVSIANQPPSSAIPWWKQKRTIIILSVIIIVAVVAIALGVSLSQSTNNNNPAVDEIGLVSPSSSPITNSSSTARPPQADDTSSTATSTISNSELKNLSMTIYGISSVEDTNSWSGITALDIECYFNGCTGVEEEGDVNKGVWDVSIDLVVVDVVSSDDKVDVDRTSLPWLITDESDKGSEEEEGERYLQQEDPQTQYVQVIYNQLSNYTTSNPTMYDDLYVATDPYAQSVSQDAYIARLQSLGNFYDDITSIGSVRQIPSDDEPNSVAPSSSPLIISLTSPPLPDITSVPPGMSGQSTPSTSSSCFSADDGGENGILYNAVRSYVSQDCANDDECEIAQTYGWPMNSWCVGNIKDMSSLFSNMDTFNEDINGWNTSSATTMAGMFYQASSFNGNVSNFNTSSVASMRAMFWDAKAFNKDVSNFDTSSVTDMFGMFRDANSFDRDVSSFDLSSVTDMWLMFYGATAFSQDLCAWQDSFPYTAETASIFTNSGCTYQDIPNEAQKGPFCASNCQSSQVVSCKYHLKYPCMWMLSSLTH